MTSAGDGYMLVQNQDCLSHEDKRPSRPDIGIGSSMTAPAALPRFRSQNAVVPIEWPVWRRILGGN